MQTIRTVALALAILAATGLLVSSAGFTSVAAERGVSVAVVDDDSAYVGYESSDTTVSDGDRMELVTVTNRLYGDLRVTDVEITADSVSFTDLDYPSMGPGESGTITGVADCEAGTTETVQVTVTLSGTGVWATIFGDSETQEREFDVTCEGPSEPRIDGVDFKGAGQVRIDATPPGETDLVYWTTEGGPGDESLSFTTHGPMAVDTNDTLQHPGQATIVAVYVPASDTSFHHPQFDLENETIESWGQGWQTGVSVDGNVSLGA